MLARCKKILVLVILFSGFFQTGNVLALGLGELTVNSSLNEPLDASIQVLGVDGLNAGQIIANLGGVDDFERANIDRVGLIDNIRLEVVIFNASEGELRLTSTAPVEEPFLSMVISVRWPNGRLMRDYNALIDLPLFVSDEPQVVPVDIPETPAPVSDPEPAPQPLPEPEPQSQVISATEAAAPVVEEMVEEMVEEVAEEIAEETEVAEESTPEVAAEPEPDLEPEVIAEVEEEVEEQAEEAEQALVAEAIEEPLPVMEEDPAEAEVVAEVSEEVAEQPAEDATVTVEPGDNLYNIAEQNRPSASVSIEQTMLAIQRENPDAFIDNNINGIRVGQVLRIPSVQAIQSIDQSQALSEIALQNQPATAQPLSFSADNSGAAQPTTDELTILSGEDGADSLTGNNDLAETIAALENQLAISEENLDRATLENQELNARLVELEDQVEILQNIIAMQDERLAQMQADLAANPAAEEVAAQPQNIVDTTAQPPQTDDSLMGRLSSAFENTLVLVGSLLGLILLVVGFLVWRRQAATDGMDDFVIAEGSAEPEAFAADEPEEESVGFLAGLKNRFSGGSDDEAAVAELNKEPDQESDAEIDDEESDEEEGGLLGKLKSIFSRSSDDDEEADMEDSVEELGQEESVQEDEDEEEEIDDSDEDVDELEEPEEDDEDSDDFIASLEEIEDFEDASAEDVETEVIFSDEESAGLMDDLIEADEESSESELDENLESDLEASLDESLDDSQEEDEDIEAAIDEDDDEDESAEIALETDDFSLPDTEETAEIEEPADDEEFDFDLGNFEMDDSGESAESSEEESTEAESAPVLTEEAPEQAIEALQEEESSQEGQEVVEEAAEHDEQQNERDEVITFESLDETPEESSPEKSSEEDQEVESFDFSLDDAPQEDSATEAAESEEAADVESFEFNVEESSNDAPAAESDEAQEDVESFEFDVSDVSSFDEKPDGDKDKPVEEAAEDVETFEFDAGAESGTEEQEVEVAEVAEEASLDSLAAALDEVDAEAGEGQGDTAEEIVIDDDDFDLGNIELDDSMFETDQDDAASEPISDRDESSTKLDLAVAYEAMGDIDGAKEILNEVIAEGNDDQVSEAKKLLEKWDQS